jgi:predicted dehydrogenase
MSESPFLRIALLGAGRIAGLVHAPVLARLPEARVVAIAERDPLARDKAGAHHPAALRFADWERALDVVALDAVVICLPPALHAEAAVAAFRRGLHVYVEKPLALTLAEADAVIAARDEAGRIGAVGFNFRHHPFYLDAARRVAAGELGRILAVRCLFTSARRPLPGWKADPRAGGGAIADLAVHHFDILAHLTGQAPDAASLDAEDLQGDEGALALLRLALADGTPVQMLVGQTTGHSAHVVELLGERGHLTIDLAETEPAQVATPPGRLARLHRLVARLRRLDPRALLAPPGRDPSFAAALGAFVAAARTGGTYRPDLGDGRRALVLALAAQEAAARRAPRRHAAE